MKTRFKKGDLVYDVEHNQLMIVIEDPLEFPIAGVFCINNTSWMNSTMAWYPKNSLTLISKSEFK